ncbi:MAG: 3-isopropylmalate dehydratase large subunit [Burkholderiales bacterium]|nr:3-isopropylmalate dehydratase large subunit [Burkholderiales bacterium]
MNAVAAQGARTLFDKLWDSHVVAQLGDDTALLHVDRHLVHDLVGGPAYAELDGRGIAVHSPALTFATADHVVSSRPDRTGRENAWAEALVDALEQGSRKRGIRIFERDQPGHGIVHVMGPELGLTLPGSLVVCGDSHTSTHGALGALAWGTGTSEITHVLATQTIVQRRPLRMRITITGRLQPGVGAKDLALAIIAKLGTSAGTGHAVEYAGPVVEALDMAGRLTLCNMTIELGARMGMIAPDEVTFGWLAGRPYAPKGADWQRAVDAWRSLRSDPEARFDREEAIDASAIQPQITWGTSPEQAIGLGGHVPDPLRASDPAAAGAIAQALAYMDLRPGQPIAGTRVDRVFIGSCTNGRIEDLRQAAAMVRGRRVAAHVTAWVVPGSEEVRRVAEAEGLDRDFAAAGFEWRRPGCSLCVGANGETVAPGERCVSTSNRNFVGRQGPGARTHLASPAVAAACAVRGAIVDRVDGGRVA